MTSTSQSCATLKYCKLSMYKYLPLLTCRNSPHSCQEADEAEPAQLVQKILDILYATEVSERFILNSTTCIINLFWHHRMALRHQTMHHQRTKSTKVYSQQPTINCLLHTYIKTERITFKSNCCAKLLN